MAMTWRDRVRLVTPPWLRNGVAAKLLYAIAMQFDALTDMVTAAVKIRFPGLYSDESLPMIGRERRIRRGRVEPSATYAKRLPRWLTDHKTRGGPYAMLAQLFAYYDGNHFPIRLVYRSGRAFDMDVDGNVTMLDVTWNPDAVPEQWARWWLIYQLPDAIPAARKYGDPGLKYGAGATYGSGFTSTEIYDLRVVPREWNAAHAIGHLVLIHLNGGAVYGIPPHKYGEPGLVYGAGGGSTKITGAIQ